MMRRRGKIYQRISVVHPLPIVIAAAAIVVFALDLLALKLGVTSVPLAFKLASFGVAAGASVVSAVLALMDVRDETYLNPPPPRRGQPHARRGPAQLAAAFLVVAMLSTAATAVGRHQEHPLGGPLSAPGVVVNVAPHVDLRGTKLVLGVSGTGAGKGAGSGSGIHLAETFLNTLGTALDDLSGVRGLLAPFLSALAKAHIAVAPTFNFGSRTNGDSVSLAAIASAIANLHLKVAPPNVTVNNSTGGSLPADCAGYYLELDQLVDDDPQIVSRLPAKLLDSRAKACGVRSKETLGEVVVYLSRR